MHFVYNIMARARNSVISQNQELGDDRDRAQCSGPIALSMNACTTRAGEQSMVARGCT